MKILLHLSLLSLFSTGLFAQCMDDQAHNTSLNSVWMSCQTSTNPFAEIGETHWIMYEFEQLEAIESINIWNINNESQLTSGARRIRMDISPNGASWTNMGTFELGIGKADPDYLGELIDDFEAFEARYVLFTVFANHGGPCSGLAEVKFNLGIGTVATIDEELAASVIISPNPADQFFNVKIEDISANTISYQLVDMTGRVILREIADNYQTRSDIRISTNNMSQGTYALNMQTEKGLVTKKIVVVHPN